MREKSLLPEWSRPERLYLWDPHFSDYGNNKIFLLYRGLEEFLMKMRIPYTLLGIRHLPGIDKREIWIKDWGPFQTREGLNWFRYAPSYLPRKLRDPEPVAIPGSGLSTTEGLILDGGNFIHNGEGTAIMTRRVFSENPGWTEQSLRAFFRDRYGIDRLFFIEEEPDDEYGHIDGLLRFLSPDRLAVSTLGDDHKEFPQWEYRQGLLRKLSLDIPRIIRIPIQDSFREINGICDTLNLNFIRWGHDFILPDFGLPIHKNNLKILSNTLPGSRLMSFRSPLLSDLLDLGGSLNCISWVKCKEVVHEF